MRIFLTLLAVLFGIVTATTVASAQTTETLYCYDIPPPGTTYNNANSQISTVIWVGELFTVPPTEVWSVTDLSVAIVRGTIGTDSTAEVSIWTTVAGAPDTRITDWVVKTVGLGTHSTSASLGEDWDCDPNPYHDSEAKYRFTLSEAEILTGGDYAIVARRGSGGTIAVGWQSHINQVPAPAVPLLRSTDSGVSWGTVASSKAESAIVGEIAAIVAPPPATLETKIQGWDATFGTGVFLIVLIIAIFGIHTVWNVPHEMIYGVGLVIGSILSHESVGVLDPYWLIAGAALIAAIYIYRLVFQSGAEQ